MLKVDYDQLYLHECLAYELELRKKKNKRYSLRSFSRSLGIDASLMQKILNHSRPLTSAMQKKINLRFRSQDPKLESVVLQLSQGTVLRQAFEDIPPVFLSLKKIAILQFFNFEPYWAEPELVAKRLGLSQAEFKSEVETLIDHQLLVHFPDGQIKSRVFNLQINGSSKISARDNFFRIQSEHHQFANSTLRQKQSFSENHFSSSVFLSSPEFLDEFKKLAQKFRMKIGKQGEKVAGRSKNHKAYMLSLALVPIE